MAIKTLFMGRFLILFFSPVNVSWHTFLPGRFERRWPVLRLGLYYQHKLASRFRFPERIGHLRATPTHGLWRTASRIVDRLMLHLGV